MTTQNSITQFLESTKRNKNHQFYHVWYINKWTGYESIERVYFLFYKSNVPKQEWIYLGIYYSPSNILIPIRWDDNHMILISKKKRFNTHIANELLSYAIAKWLSDNADHQILDLNDRTPCVTFVESLVDL